MRHRRQHVTWLPTVWNTVPGEFSIGLNTLSSVGLVENESTPSTVWNSANRRSIDLRLMRLIGDIEFIETAPADETHLPAPTVGNFHYGICIGRQNPVDGVFNDLNDWHVENQENQKRWLWRRCFPVLFEAGVPQGPLLKDILPWGTWHDIKPRARCRFGEEGLFLVTFLDMNPSYNGTVVCSVHMRSLWKTE